MTMSTLTTYACNNSTDIAVSWDYLFEGKVPTKGINFSIVAGPKTCDDNQKYEFGCGINFGDEEVYDGAVEFGRYECPAITEAFNKFIGNSL